MALRTPFIVSVDPVVGFVVDVIIARVCWIYACVCVI